MTNKTKYINIKLQSKEWLERKTITLSSERWVLHIVWSFIIGLFIGSTVTLVVMSALIMGSKSDDQLLGGKQYEE